jgi:hypothetical protein
VCHDFPPQSAPNLKIRPAISVFDTRVFRSDRFTDQVSPGCPYDFLQPGTAPSN